MRELGMAVVGCMVIFAFFSLKIYPSLEYTGYSSNQSCTGECYREYVALNGTSVDQLKAKQVLAAGDPFSDIRSLWSGCAACHGPDGGGGVGPKLAGQTADYINGRLIAYKNKEQVGPMSAMMWGQAAMLSDKQISMIGEYIQAGLPEA